MYCNGHQTIWGHATRPRRRQAPEASRARPAPNRTRRPRCSTRRSPRCAMRDTAPAHASRSRPLAAPYRSGHRGTCFFFSPARQCCCSRRSWLVGPLAGGGRRAFVLGAARLLASRPLRTIIHAQWHQHLFLFAERPGPACSSVCLAACLAARVRQPPPRVSAGHRSCGCSRVSARHMHLPLATACACAA